MGTLENFENAWDVDFQFEHVGLEKTLPEECSHGCACKSEADHKKEAVLGKTQNLKK